MISTLPKEYQKVVDNSLGLNTYLRNLQKGRDQTPRSWLYETKSTDSIRKMWIQQLRTLSDGSPEEKLVFEFDISQLEKWGPQGKVAPISKLMKDVVEPTFAEADSPRPSAFNSNEWLSAVSDATRYLQTDLHLRGLRPASYEKVIRTLGSEQKLETNSGWPLFTRRNKPVVVQSAILDASNGNWNKYPAIALFRNYRGKTRLVWMFPMSANLYETARIQPLQKSIMDQNEPFFCAWKGFDYVRQLVTDAYDNGKYLSATDFSSTDAHFTIHSSREVFHCISPLYSNATIRDDVWQSIKNMHNIPLVISPTQWFTGLHGVSSGSSWTNFIETIFDLILGNYFNRIHPNSRALFAIGDDMCWVSDEYDEDFAKKAEHLGSEVGQIIQASKATNERDSVKTLQRLFQRGYRRPDGKLRGVYSTIRALNSLIFPERFHDPDDWDSDMFCGRCYSILENCVDHPLFEDFVRFVAKGQKDLIPFAKQKREQLDKVTRRMKLVTGILPTYNPEVREGSLADLESIRIASNL